MEFDGYLAVIATEAARMAAVAEEAGLEAKTPTCPTWNIRKLILHQGEVHRWATAVVAGRYTSFAKMPKDTLGKLPSDAKTMEWFRDGVTALIDTLANGDPEVAYDMFLRQPSSWPRLLLWARRQAMELCIHRVDAESAVARCTPFPPKVAAEGVDEFLASFIVRGKGAVHRDPPQSIAFVPNDVDDRWTVTFSEGPIVTERTQGRADCTVSAPASDMFLALWNRPPRDAMKVMGDTSLLTDLAANVRIRWS